jgi:hypothetical protein
LAIRFTTKHTKDTKIPNTFSKSFRFFATFVVIFASQPQDWRCKIFARLNRYLRDGSVLRGGSNCRDLPVIRVKGGRRRANRFWREV